MDSLQFKLCDIQGRLFELFSDCGYDIPELVKIFMTGELAENLDSDYNRMQWAGEEYLLEELIASNKDKLQPKRQNVNNDVLFWIGYLYRYWHYYTKEDSKVIYKQADFGTMNVNYLMFHTMDPEMAIDDLKEIYKQKSKKVEKQSF